MELRIKKFFKKICILTATFIAAAAISINAAAQDGGGAVLSNVHGNVRLQFDGSVLWVPAQDGDAVPPKTKIKTNSNSGAALRLRDGGFVKLTPFDEMLYDVIYEANGKQSDVVMVESGRVWAMAKPGETTERLILETPGGAVDIREGAVFLETDPNTRVACVDVFSGAAGARSVADPAKVVTIDTNKRASIDASGAPSDPVAVNGVFDTENNDYTCLTNTVNKVTTGNTVVEAVSETDAYSIVRLSASGMTEFLGSGKKNEEETVTTAQYAEEGIETEITLISSASVTFEKCTPTGESCADNGDCCSALCSSSVCTEQKDSGTLDSKGILVFPVETTEISTEYAIIEVTKSSTVTFSEPKCETTPLIEAVAIGDKALSDGETTIIEGAECASSAQPQVSFNVTPRCGSIITLTIKTGSASNNLGEVGQGQTSSFSSTINLQNTTAVPVEIYAADSFNNTATFKFNAQLQLHESLSEAPEVSSVTINGQTVNAGDRVELTINSCGETTLSVTGKAASRCGTISSVTLNKDGSSQRVTGTADWSSTISLPSTGNEASFEAKAKNSLGVESEAFTFDLTITRELDPPTISFTTIGGNPVDDTSVPIDVYRDQLESGKLVIRGSAESAQCTLSKVEVSLNDGSSWAAAQDTSSWSYSFQPSAQTYQVRARAVDAAGTVSEEALNAIELTYHSTTPEEDLLDIFNKLITAYLNKNSSGFLDLTSSNYNSSYEGIEDSNSLDDSLGNKFIANPVMYLKYQVNSVTASGDTGQVSFNWTANQSSAGYTESAVFQFAKEEEGWRFITVRDDHTFLRYTSIAATVALQSADSEVIADNSDNTTVTAEVRDSAHNLIKDGTEVRFSTTLGSVTASATTRSGIAEATFFGGSTPGNATISATCGAISATPIVIAVKREHAPPPPDQ